jgi:hypothetical protein
VSITFQNRSRLVAVIVLTSLYMVVEVLRRGLSSIVKRKLLFDDLTRFYEEHFGKGERGEK